MQLGHDHALGTIDDEGTGFGHQRQVAHVDFLLFHVLHRLLLGRAFLVIDDQADLDPQRRTIAHAAQLAFLDVKGGLTQLVADVFKRSITRNMKKSEIQT